MQDFRPDCTINLHVTARGDQAGKPAQRAWSCSIVHPKHGRLVFARRSLGAVSREEAETAALLFGLRQAARFLQEKVELAATFPLEGKLGAPNKSSRGARADLQSEASTALSPKAEIARAWDKFRLKRVARMRDGEAKELAELALAALGGKT